MTTDPATALKDAVRQRFAEALTQIEHCVNQLRDEDLDWRPIDSLNSISNIILHLCGNVRQWIISGVGGAPDVRDRPAEFADRTRYDRAELLGRLRATMNEVDAALARLAPGDLVAPRRIQGFDKLVIVAVIDTVAHFAGHVQEITYITRLRLGDAYGFRWVPQTKEQGAPAGKRA